MATPLPQILSNLHNAAEAAGRPPPRLLAVSKTQPAEAVAALAAQGQRAFGENVLASPPPSFAALETAPVTQTQVVDVDGIDAAVRELF